MKFKQWIKENFIPVEITPEEAEGVSDLHKINIGGSEYEFMRWATNSNIFEIAKDDKIIGRASLNDYDKNSDGAYLDSIRIDPEYRRLGLATKMYEYIEGVIGKKLQPSPVKQSPEIQQFWKKNNEI